jgi:hypothetical protein
VQIIKRDKEIANLPDIGYIPRIQDARPQIGEMEINFKRNNLCKVIQIVDENTLRLSTGQIVTFLGVKIEKRDAVLNYLHDKVLGKKIILKYDEGVNTDNEGNKNNIGAYVYLHNKLFINGYLIKSGLALPDLEVTHRLQDKFSKWAQERE